MEQAFYSTTLLRLHTSVPFFTHVGPHFLNTLKFKIWSSNNAAEMLDESFWEILPFHPSHPPSAPSLLFGTRRLAVVMPVWTVAKVMPQRRCSNSLCLALARHVKHISIQQCLAVKFRGISKWPRDTWINQQLLSSENENCISLASIMIRVGNVVSNYSGMMLLGLMDEQHGPTCNTYQWNHLCLALWNAQPKIAPTPFV